MLKSLNGHWQVPLTFFEFALLVFDRIEYKIKLCFLFESRVANSINEHLLTKFAFQV